MPGKSAAGVDPKLFLPESSDGGNEDLGDETKSGMKTGFEDDPSHHEINRELNEVFAQDSALKEDEWGARLSERAGRAMLAQKKCAVMAAIGRVEQSGNHSIFGAYSTESDYLDAIRPAMAKAGIALSVKMVGTNTQKHGKTKSGADRFFTTADLVFTLTCSHTGFCEDHTWLGVGIDEEDKGIPKALAQAEKYFLAKTFLMSSGDGGAESGNTRSGVPDSSHSGSARPAGKKAAQKVDDALEAVALEGEPARAVVQFILQREAERDDITSSEANMLYAILTHAAEVAGDSATDFLLYCVDHDARINSKRLVENHWDSFTTKEAA